ncbi:TPA: HNH endonuclease [Stenotrophomonas maltophilia]|nr:HNH endonuclease [Stenotrophomonas maltophilia]
MSDSELAKIKNALDYDPGTGIFRRRRNTSRLGRAGAVAGSLNVEGYRYIKIGSKCYKANRLAWLFVHGAWPTMFVDHINGRKDDDRIANLRLCTNSENCQNRSRAKGAYKTKKGPGYFSVVTVNGTRHYLGRFRTAELARAAYVEAKARLHPFQNIENIAQ